MTYRVGLERAAVEGLAALDRGDQRQVHERLQELEDVPHTGKPLGNRAGINLTGWHKLVLCNRRVRVIFRVEEPDLVRELGEDYRAYQREVGGFLPKRRPAPVPAEATR